MSEPRVDYDLKERFQELRAAAEQEGRLPDFAALRARAEASAVARPQLEVIAGRLVPSRRRVVRAGAWASAALAAAVTGLLLVDRGQSAEEFELMVAAYASDVSAGEWRSPTSGLLEVPGIDLVRSVPAIGGALPGIEPSTAPEAAPTPGPREDA